METTADTSHAKFVHLIESASSEASYAKLFGFKRLGLHRVVLRPGEVSSNPHAESLEEEFVYVVSGRPHIWIDGYVYETWENCAVGFPSGTGIAHNVINNTNEDVVLLVAGERSKKENLCSFPVNPEVAEKSPINWKDAPVRTLGPHSGRAGSVLPVEKGGEWPSFLIDCTKLERSVGWHYQGDTETFTSYKRLTDLLGLKVLGIGHEILAPGRRSSFPHSHSVEEEFVFILKGRATVWIHGHTHEAATGAAVGFPSGTGLSHCVINNSDEPVEFLVFGEATEAAGQDFIHYSTHAFRNHQCEVRGDIWNDGRPRIELGPHSGRPDESFPDRLAIRLADMSTRKSSDEDLILDLFKRSPTYFRVVDGEEPHVGLVTDALVSTPKKLSSKYRKEFLIVEHVDDPIGVVDLHIHHPEEGVAYLGLLLFDESRFGKGFGRRTYNLVERYLRETHKVNSIRLGVSKDNNVTAFWHKLGFKENGHTYQWQGAARVNDVVELERSIANA